MALCRLSFTSSAASNWKLPRAPDSRTSESWGLNRRSGETGPWPPSAAHSPHLITKWQPEHAGPSGTGNETEGRWVLRR